MYLEEKEYPKSEGLYLVFASSFAVLLVLTNIIGIKLFTAPLYSITSKLLFFIPQDANGFALTTGIITYPLTFLVTDVVSEIWGEKQRNHLFQKSPNFITWLFYSPGAPRGVYINFFEKY